MSKIAKLIAAQRNTPGQQFSTPYKFNYVDVKEAYETLPYDDMVTYSIRANLGTDIHISETEQLKNKDCIHYATLNVKRAVIEEIFGEFRPLLTQMQVELYNRNFEKLRDLLYTLQHQMFEEGL